MRLFNEYEERGDALFCARIFDREHDTPFSYTHMDDFLYPLSWGGGAILSK